MKRFGRQLSKFIQARCYSQELLEKKSPLNVSGEVNLPVPEYDVQFICNPSNRDLIANNISKRNSHGNIDRVLELSKTPESSEFLKEIDKIPNLTDPNVLQHETEFFVINQHGDPPKFNFKPQEFSNLASKLKLMRTDNLGPVTGSRSYILIGDLAELEQALINYTVQELCKLNFQLVSVPDILPSQVIERCGLISDGERKLVYKLQPHYGGDLSLSGTAEMALAYKLTNRLLNFDELPLKLAAVSRCYRAEVSGLAEERGIYRVHQFTKVEMFICSSQNDSFEIQNEIIKIQEKLFKQLGLHFKTIDMPPHELGSPAYRKVDIEAWMPGRNQFGEISSCSNCTDYQARRLGIKYENKDKTILHAHTLNGTACAIPRMLIAICETNQLEDGTIRIPDPLVSFMNGKKIIETQNFPQVRQFKGKPKLD
ncbi:serine--tRNA ligase, mitochondrial [Trichogramma pretiosum]|uniref:serine--tRNA ligase, mitochondrial n=1 Tax=Trichogramma pretiosum TaxID=7493 RepID=UPI0006C98D87|nr:serine--tRNA ligase, mitochondrial [Trichogramma pretiosum]